MKSDIVIFWQMVNSTDIQNVALNVWGVAIHSSEPENT